MPWTRSCFSSRCLPVISNHKKKKKKLSFPSLPSVTYSKTSFSIFNKSCAIAWNVNSWSKGETASNPRSSNNKTDLALSVPYRIKSNYCQIFFLFTNYLLLPWLNHLLYIDSISVEQPVRNPAFVHFLFNNKNESLGIKNKKKKDLFPTLDIELLDTPQLLHIMSQFVPQ